MNNPMQPRILSAVCAIAAAALAPSVSAQQVHYPDDQHSNPPQFGFPLYTPGAGQNGNSVRVQLHCPDTFLQNEGLAAGYVTHVGLSIGGSAPYDEFVLRAGTTSLLTLGSDWTANLPDQRIQNDLSGTMIVGGGTAQSPVNEWVDFALDFPFYYEPGDHVVVDLTAKLSQANLLCSTTVGGGLVQRAYNFSYTAGQSATNFNSSGLKFRLLFAPPEMVRFGAGCSSPGNVAPQIGAIGSPQIGSTIVATADQAIPNGVGVFLFGFSKTEYLGNPLPQSVGGGCELLVAADVLQTIVTPASGSAAYPLTIPNDPTLRGAVVYTQFAQYDLQSPASIPFVVSDGGIFSIF